MPRFFLQQEQRALSQEPGPELKDGVVRCKISCMQGSVAGSQKKEEGGHPVGIKSKILTHSHWIRKIDRFLP